MEIYVWEYLGEGLQEGEKRKGKCQKSNDEAENGAFK